MKKILLLIFLPLKLISQNTIGLPDIVNYSKQTYNAGLQNWDIKQDNNGIIYVANNEGLLLFNGINWDLFPLPNKTIVHSLEIGKDNRIYVGGQDELGYFSPAQNGRLQYHSLSAFLSEKDKTFGDVWDIVSFNNDIFFRTTNKIFRFSNGAVTAFVAASEWTYLGICNGKIYAHDYLKGIIIFKNEGWNPLLEKNILALNDPVSAILPLGNDSSFIITLKNGVFILSKNSITKLASVNNELFENERIYSATMINSERIALATNNSGIYIIDKKGNIIQTFSKTDGLENNNVLSIFLDKQSNLWLGLDNGIALIAYNSAIKLINPQLKDGSGYATIICKDRLFVGTTNGLYSVTLQPNKDLSFSKGNFLLVNNTKGQVWGLAEINNHLLLGKHEGAFLVKDNTAQAISYNPGFWNFVPMSGSYPNLPILAGNYNGLVFFNYTNGQFIQTRAVPGFEESSRYIALDKEDNIWVSHPYHGIYKISKKSDGTYSTRIYTKNNGLPSSLNNHVYTIKNEVVFATEKGVYFYDAEKDRFEPSPYYKNLLGQQSIRYLKEDKLGNIWFIHEKMLGVADLSGKEPQIIYLTELNNKILSGFEFIYPFDENNIFISGWKGVFHVNYEKYKNTVTDLQVQIRSVRIFKSTDSLLFGGYFKDVNEKQIQDEKKIPEINYKWKTLRLEFSSSLFGFQSNTEYSYRLKGFDKNWSDWTKRTEKEYTNLPEGKYYFEVKARNNLGNESPVAVYSFIMLPPWYQALWAKFLYGLFFVSFIYYLYKWQEKRFITQQLKHEEEQKKLLYIHELELSKTESELIALRNEKLEAEINFKNSELASSAMHLVKKGEIITKSKSELAHVMKGLNNPQATSELKKMIKTLTDDDNMDKEWEKFAKHFDTVHSSFLAEIKERHPAITANELKLSAYLRMNLSTKEIAQLMNISVRGVEISRYRLRKKLQIAKETSLFDYLINIKTNH